MTICAKKRSADSNAALRPAFWAAGALAAICAVLAAGCGGDEPFTSVVIAVRTDGGSPALSAFAGDLESNPVELPPGSYWVQAVNDGGGIFSFGEMEIEAGEAFAVSPFSGFEGNPKLADAMRTTANFLIDVEMGRLHVMETMSGGYATELFDPAAEPSGDDIETLFQSFGELAVQEEDLMAALRTIDDASAEAREPVLYVDARAPARGALLNDIIDMMPQFFKDIATVSERERARVLDIAKEMSAQDKDEAFGQMPENLRGGAANFDQWLGQVKNGRHDNQLGAIHGHLHVSAGEATSRSGHTLGRTMAEEGAPLVKSGFDLTVKAYGKVPGLGKAIDLTKKVKEWDAYLQKVYADPLGTLEASARKSAEAALTDKIKKDLAKLAPGLSKSTLDDLAKQLAKSVVAAVPSLKTSPTAVPVARGNDEEWIEGIVQEVADRLLADGESGIDTAVVTDDLRQCLKEVLATASTRLDTLARCTLETKPETWIDEATSSALRQFEAAGSSEDEALGQAIAYGNCLRVASWSGRATKEEAIEECKGLLGITPPAEPTAAPTAPPTAAPTPAATPAPTPCQNQTDDGVGDLDDLTECQGAPTPVKTPCADFDPLCGLSQ